MGIDIYMRWKGQTALEHAKQITGFNIMSGDTGYLREAYHGEPYATEILLPEAFDRKLKCDINKCSHDFHNFDCKYNVPFTAAILRDRLENAQEAVITRYSGESQEFIDNACQSYVDFVKLAEEMEKKTGEPVKIYASY